MKTVAARTPLVAILALAALGAAPRTAAAQIAVLSSTVQEHDAAPGERYTGTIRVLNPSAEPQTVRIYQTDYLFDARGTSRFDAVGTVARSNARWVALGAGQLTVPAGTETSVTYTVSVPAGDTLRGSFWSTVMVEGLPSGAAATAHARGVGVGAVVRYAIQVATHVGGGDRLVRFSDVALHAADTANVLELVVANVGERAYRPALWVELYDEGGALRARRRQERGLLYPGTSLRQRFDLGALAAGGYRAVVFADAGGDAVHAATYRVRR